MRPLVRTLRLKAAKPTLRPPGSGLRSALEAPHADSAARHVHPSHRVRRSAPPPLFLTELPAHPSLPNAGHAAARRRLHAGHAARPDEHAGARRPTRSHQRQWQRRLVPAPPTRLGEPLPKEESFPRSGHHRLTPHHALRLLRHPQPHQGHHRHRPRSNPEEHGGRIPVRHPSKDQQHHRHSQRRPH